MSEQSDSEQFLNISIVDSKHFLEPEHLFTELATSDGCVLFECASLLKANGIDLMNCPLQISLKIFVRRRDEGTPILHHMVLPLAVISKQVLQPPHEWETWVGLLPSNNSLEVCAPSDMFAHAVINLLADKTSPKLRLKFRYHNPQLHAHMALQKQSEEERRQQQNLVKASYGQQRFQDLHLPFTKARQKTERGDNLTHSMESVERSTVGEEEKVKQSAASDAPKDPKEAVEEEQTRIDEQNLAESLRFAMLGALGDVGMDGALMEPPELQAIKVRFPQLWLICQDVSKMANDMAKLAEEAEVSGAVQLQEENSRLRMELEQSQLQLKKAEEEIAQLRVFHGQSPEIDLL